MYQVPINGAKRKPALKDPEESAHKVIGNPLGPEQNVYTRI